MDDSASSEEIEWCRNYFKLAKMDVFEIINKAIDVAAHDHPNQLRFQKYRIAQRLFSGTLSSSSTWNFPPLLEISDENSVINNPVPKFDQDRHDASNPNVDFEVRPRLTLRIKTKRNNEEEEEEEEEQYGEAEGEPSVKSRVKDKDNLLSKKRVKKASRKDRKDAVAKSSLSAKKRKLSGEAEVLRGANEQHVPTSIQKITKIRFVHGFH